MIENECSPKSQVYDWLKKGMEPFSSGDCKPLSYFCVLYTQ